MAAPLGVVRLPVVSDAAVIDFLSSLAEECEGASFAPNIPGRSYGTYETKAQFLADHDRDWSGSRLLSSSTATVVEQNGAWITITFYRGVRDAAGQLGSSQWETELEVRRSTGNPPAPTADSVEYVWDAVDAFRKKVTKGRGASDAGGPLRDVLSTEIAQLGELHIDMVKRADEARARREEEIEEKRQALHVEFQAKQVELNKLLASEQARLQEEKDHLQARARQLDDRAHMHARRDLRSEITQTLAARLQRPGVSTNALLLRGAVTAAMLIGVAATGWIALTASQEVSQLIQVENSAAANQQRLPDRIALYATLGRLAISSTVCVALIFYLIGWLRRILEQDERSEREVERYRYDIDRATWAIETILEVQGKEGAEIPHEWVKGVTHGLFEVAPKKDEDTTALEALGALLNISAKAELGPNGPRIELNRSSLKKLGKQADELAE